MAIAMRLYPVTGANFNKILGKKYEFLQKDGQIAPTPFLVGFMQMVEHARALEGRIIQLQTKVRTEGPDEHKANASCLCEQFDHFVVEYQNARRVYERLSQNLQSFTTSYVEGIACEDNDLYTNPEKFKVYNEKDAKKVVDAVKLQLDFIELSFLQEGKVRTYLVDRVNNLKDAFSLNP